MQRSDAVASTSSTIRTRGRGPGAVEAAAEAMDKDASHGMPLKILLFMKYGKNCEHKQITVGGWSW